MNEQRKTIDHLESVEAAIDIVRKAASDGEVTASEIMDIIEGLYVVYEGAMGLDQTARAIVTLTRRGLDSPSFDRQVTEMRRDRERMEDERPPLVVIRGGKRDETPNPAA